MDVTEVELHIGAGQVQLDLTGPRKSDLNVSVKGGVGQATIRLPKDVGVTAHASGGIGSVHTEGLHENGSEYTNDAYGKSPHKITLDVQGGIGEIELIQEP
jgi:predicted membrane protein